ncbi:hypothetical protein G5714_009579 [Onychostoma macrolepis]|uniref:Uncharacterized protein n=1 Tax=Onychostoma macrolepis TaxID=369639 RepID=A0A7J6CSN6_9TELE|nr:hypothetical protein G5714_009579 [Onychostoma macrolepis]
MLISYDSRVVLERHPSNLFTPGVLIRAVDLGTGSTVPCDVTAAPRGSYSPPPVPSCPVPQQNRPLPRCLPPQHQDYNTNDPDRFLNSPPLSCGKSPL